ncbi:hypothetical protein BASA83_011081 [Batrachochytrium salamandrivorans]|nr:hypothetical protein BASA83_011081 [Batrachochytrium salamandrivorans]
MTAVYSDLISLLTAFGTNIAISAGLVIGFSLLRPTNKNVYEPRRKFAENTLHTPLMKYIWLTRSASTPSVSSFYQGAGQTRLWNFDSCSHSLCDLNFHSPSIDPPFHRGMATALGLCRIQPESYSFQHIEHDQSRISVVLHSWRFLPGSSLAMPIVLLYTTWSEYIDLRKKYFSSPEYLHSYHSRCLLVTDIPESMHKEGALKEFVNSAGLSYPATQVLIGRNFENLPQLMKEHTAATLALEGVFVKYLKDPYNLPSERPTHKIGGYIFHLIGGTKVDSIDHYGKEIRRLESSIYELRSKGDQYFKPNSSAFISFDTIKGSHSAAHKLSGFISTSIRTQSITPASVQDVPQL